jgi:hypothetical protein
MGGLIDTVQDPTYTAAVGLMMLDMLLVPSGLEANGQPNGSVFGLIDGLMKKFRR